MNTAQIHLLLNHIPVLGVIAAGLLLIYAMIFKKEEIKQISLFVFVISALFTIPVYFSGESAEEIVEHLPGVMESTIERHEDFAKYALISVEILGILALVALGYNYKKKTIPYALTGSVLGLYFLTCGILIQTAHLGGQIRHTEIVSANINLPNQGSESGHHEKDDDDD